MNGWPDFIGVGAAKCGTTALYYYLKQHPEIWVPSKDSYFYSPEAMSALGLSHKVVEQSDYQTLFFEPLKKGSQVSGEVASFYFHCHQEVIPRIKEFVGNPKILISLRNPANRAWSNYWHYARDLRELRSFTEAIQEEIESPNEIPYNRRYLGMGLYAEPLEAFLNSFSDVKVLIFEQLCSDPVCVIQDVCSWLGVDPEFEPDITARYNSSGVPRLKWLQKALFAPSPLKLKVKEFVVRCGISEDSVSRKIDMLRRKNLRRQTMEDRTRERLEAFYRDDVLRVEEILGIKLDVWRR